MSTEENKALARRELEEIFSAKGNLDAAEEIYAPNYISHQPAGAEDIHGLEAIKQFNAGVRRATKHTVELPLIARIHFAPVSKRT
jgi:hypothetical protein